MLEIFILQIIVLNLLLISHIFQLGVILVKLIICFIVFVVLLIKLFAV
jgi:hypothetical protein